MIINLNIKRSTNQCNKLNTIIYTCWTYMFDVQSNDLNFNNFDSLSLIASGIGSGEAPTHESLNILKAPFRTIQAIVA